MDSIALIFAAFLNTLTQPVQDHLFDSLGLMVEAKVVAYQSQQIDYQYQRWLINHDSVCQQKKSQLINSYSDCTIAAKQFFQATCNHLQLPNRRDRYFLLHKNMYCHAAVSYTPVIASIDRLSETESEILEAKQACAMLTLKAGRTASNAVEKSRKEACAYAQQIRDKYNQP
ncbi:hypothetical protein Q7C_177 [Methylophaga frappieri]|uniref:Uncharacterized protein n=1 Tax=Methylophaga frappieri (strain ATCC BAA-2434 / DSM 25690 / JAM7) TaxID=754477 RepID=I1YEL5_METFJ|nr:hypothetical protein [Methylophaga frappieri]AFJ01358.1 hypothetical protein Q7C_177 [Methylophaga frappieri]